MEHRSAKLAWILKALAEEVDECILCPFTPSQRYPLMHWEGRTRLAHHVVMMLSGKGDRPEGLEARHLCGEARCVNKRHLEWGTHSENERDKQTHGSLRPERYASSRNTKLTVDDVRAIRASREPRMALAERYGVGVRCIKKIRGRETWRWVV